MLTWCACTLAELVDLSEVFSHVGRLVHVQFPGRVRELQLDGLRRLRTAVRTSTSRLEPRDHVERRLRRGADALLLVYHTPPGVDHGDQV